jgi:hypothetical protein
MPSATSCLRIVALAFSGVNAADDQMLLQADVLGVQPGVPAVYPLKVDEAGSSGDGVSDGLSELLSHPSSVLEEMTNKVGALTKKMAEMKKTNEIKMASQADMFKKRLQEIDANNTGIVNENLAIKTEIDSLVASNADKRDKAKELGKVNSELLVQLKSARMMIETAAEFVDKSIKDNSDIEVDDLKILKELDDEDTNSAAMANHQGRLEEVAQARKPPLQMLDVSPSKTMPANDLVDGLEAGLEMFAQEAKKSEDKLKARFLSDFKQASARQSQLLQEQATLKAQRQSLKALQARLAVAVAHVEQTHASLLEKVQSVQGFAAGKLGHLNEALQASGQ